MMEYTLLAITAILGLIGILFKTSIDRNDGYRRNPTIAGWIIFILIFTSFSISIYLKYDSNKAKDIQKEIDSIKYANTIKLLRDDSTKSVELIKKSERLASLSDSNRLLTQKLYIKSESEAKILRGKIENQREISLSRIKILLQAKIEFNSSAILRDYDYERLKEISSVNSFSYMCKEDRLLLFPTCEYDIIGGLDFNFGNAWNNYFWFKRDGKITNSNRFDFMNGLAIISYDKNKYWRESNRIDMYVVNQDSINANILYGYINTHKLIISLWIDPLCEVFINKRKNIIENWEKILTSCKVIIPINDSDYAIEIKMRCSHYELNPSDRKIKLCWIQSGEAKLKNMENVY